MSDLRKKVLEEAATEPPFSGKLLQIKSDGSYHCGKCSQLVFKSDSKFESGSGWPSFDKAVNGSVELKTDKSHGMVREEVVCANCGAHLGHKFDDGPSETTGQRYCINSVALDFVDKEGKKIEG